MPPRRRVIRKRVRKPEALEELPPPLPEATQCTVVVTITRPEICCVCLEHFDDTAVIEMRNLDKLCTSGRHLQWPRTQVEMQAYAFVGKYLQTPEKYAQRICTTCFHQALQHCTTDNGLYRAGRQWKIRCPMCWPDQVCALRTPALRSALTAQGAHRIGEMLHTALITAKRERRYPTFYCTVPRCDYREIRTTRYDASRRGYIECPNHGRQCVQCFRAIDDWATHTLHCRLIPLEFAKMVGDVRRCPHCHTPMEKGEGCNYMTCRCRRTFHWHEAKPFC